MRVPVGAIASVPDTECVAVGDGRAVVVRVGGELRAFENRCAHQESPIAGGLVRKRFLLEHEAPASAGSGRLF